MSKPTNATIAFSASNASVLLDLVRGLAALLVLLSHWKVLFFVNYPEIPGPHAAFAIPYVLCDAGHQAVVIFFVLSGYLISGSVFRALERDTWSWRSYLTHRFVRLWIVVLPGLLLGGLLDWIGIHFAHCPGLYSTAVQKTHGIDVAVDLKTRFFLGNLAFLQTWLVPCFGSNASFWSLANEFWYYILFPLVWIGWRGRFTAVQRAVSLMLFVGIAWLVREPFLPLFPVWIAGTALNGLPSLRCGNLFRSVAAVTYAVAVLAFAKLHFGLTELQGDYLFGAITVLFLWILLSARSTVASGWHVRPVRTLARFSFSLYVLHLPALLLLSALTAGTQVWSPKDPRRDLLAVVVLLATLVYAYLVAAMTEFHTDTVRSWIERRLGIRDSNSGGASSINFKEVKPATQALQ
ncbi:MAG: acyltransferase family protein [Janthinobacterium lividum]